MSEGKEMNELVKTETTAITPMEMIQQGVASGASLEQMQQLMDLQERWEKNEARKAFDAAMSDFKANPPTLTKNKTVSFNETTYDHATLDMVVNTVSPELSKHGLSHKWVTEQLEGGAIKVSCVITHRMGHNEQTALQGSPDSSGAKNNIQAIGSTVTYLQRYTLLSALGLAVDGQDKDATNVGNITDEEFNELAALIEEVGSSNQAFCKRFSIQSVKELPAAKFRTARNALISKKGSKK